MKNEFYDAYTQLFQNSFNRLRRTIRIKLKAINYCDKFNVLDQQNKNKLKKLTSVKQAENILDEFKIQKEKEKDESINFVFEPIL